MNLARDLEDLLLGSGVKHAQPPTPRVAEHADSHHRDELPVCRKSDIEGGKVRAFQRRQFLTGRDFPKDGPLDAPGPLNGVQAAVRGEEEVAAAQGALRSRRL